jgi:uncharacterized protein (DUF433 family)
VICCIKTTTQEPDMSEHPRIESNPAVMLGKPVIRGTRITVEIILRRIADGFSVEDIIEDYPNVTRQDVLDAVTYAADLIARQPAQHAT